MKFRLICFGIDQKMQSFKHSVVNIWTYLDSQQSPGRFAGPLWEGSAQARQRNDRTQLAPQLLISYSMPYILNDTTWYNNIHRIGRFKMGHRCWRYWFRWIMQSFESRRTIDFQELRLMQFVVDGSVSSDSAQRCPSWGCCISRKAAAYICYLQRQQ